MCHYAVGGHVFTGDFCCRSGTSWVFHVVFPDGTTQHWRLDSIALGELPCTSYLLYTSTEVLWCYAAETLVIPQLRRAPLLDFEFLAFDIIGSRSVW
jgi:hypothetical protein